MKKYVTIKNVNLIRETEKAYLCELEDLGDCWFPKSEVVKPRKYRHGWNGTLKVSLWLMREIEMKVEKQR